MTKLIYSPGFGNEYDWRNLYQRKATHMLGLSRYDAGSGMQSMDGSISQIARTPSMAAMLRSNAEYITYVPEVTE